MGSPEPEVASTASEAEQVLVDALLIAHHRYGVQVRALCSAAVQRRQALSPDDVGNLLVARARLELDAISASFALCDHWAETGSGDADLDDDRASLQEAVGRIRDRDLVIDSLGFNIARNQLRARRLASDPRLIECDAFFAEIALERRAVESVAGEVLDTGRQLFARTVAGER